MNDAQLINALVTALKEVHLIPEKSRLWTKGHIASYVNKSEDVVDRMTVLPDFPEAIRIPTITGRMHPQWKATEVISWVEGHQEKRRKKII